MLKLHPPGSWLVPWHGAEALRKISFLWTVLAVSVGQTQHERTALSLWNAHLASRAQAAASQEDGELGCNTWEARTLSARLSWTAPSEQESLVHSYYSPGFLPLLLQYLLYASWNMFLQGILAFSLVQIRKEPPIFRWREYVSSGGGTSRCFSMIGIKPWIFSVVLWLPKSKGSSDAKASPRMRTAFKWASSISYPKERGINNITSHVNHQGEKGGVLALTAAAQEKYLYIHNTGNFQPLARPMNVWLIQFWATKTSRRPPAQSWNFSSHAGGEKEGLRFGVSCVITTAPASKRKSQNKSQSQFALLPNLINRALRLILTLTTPRNLGSPQPHNKPISSYH